MNSIELASSVRRRSLIAAHRARASHIGSSLSIADILAVLYGRVLRVDPDDSRWEERDRFILSKGHACLALYAVLAERGFFPTDWLHDYGADGSALMQHASHHVPGVELSTGSLGHGLPFAVGKALAGPLRGSSHRVYALLSDGELDEGSNWEALLFASHHGLRNLTIVIDYNGLQSLDSTEKTLSLEPLADKFSAFGCHVIAVDGHDHEALYQALCPRDHGTLPTVVIASTVKGKGVSFMENQVLWHYRNPNDDQLTQALAELSADA